MNYVKIKVLPNLVIQDQYQLNLGILKENQNTDGAWLNPVLDSDLPELILSETENSVANETIPRDTQNSIEIFGGKL